QPPILHRKAHPVEHQAIQHFGVCGDAPELKVRKKDLGESVERKQFGLSARKVIGHFDLPFFFAAESSLTREQALFFLPGQDFSKLFANLVFSRRGEQRIAAEKTSIMVIEVPDNKKSPPERRL